MQIFVSHQLNNNTLSWESRFLERISNYFTNTHYFSQGVCSKVPQVEGLTFLVEHKTPWGLKLQPPLPALVQAEHAQVKQEERLPRLCLTQGPGILGVPESGGMRFWLLRNFPPPPFLGDQFLEPDCKVRAGSIPLRLLRPKTWGWDGSLCQIYYLGSKTNKQNNSYLKCIASLAIEVSLSNSSF